MSGSTKGALAGRVAVVTGAASGIGLSIARTLAREGARLVLADIDTHRLDAIAPTIGATDGASAIGIAVDCRKPENLAALVDRAESEGPLAIWCNVAGIAASRPIQDVDEGLYALILGVNLAGTYWGCQAAARAMMRHGRGIIINVSSNAADEPIAGLSLYAMSKAAVNMLTRSLAKELGPAGIRVNAIAPGFTVTPMTISNAAEADAIIARNAERSPLGMVGAPEDIAEAALYLASDASRFVTGQILRVNGGVTMP